LASEAGVKSGEALIAPVDRRSTDRRYMKRGPIVRFLAKPSFKPVRAMVLNFSSEGLGIVARRPVEPGAVLAIQLGEIWSEFSSVVIAEVRHCSAIAKDRWLIGCVIPRGLSMDDILALAGETPVVDYPE
jgi:hypothetical protein